MPDLKRTPLFDLHTRLGAKMVPFAGYDMPVQYPPGVLQEHLWTRQNAGLFDVSHMGQIKLTADSADAAARALEALAPADILSLKAGRQRYALFTNDTGGILDDLMVARRADHLLLVVNAACKDADLAHLQSHLTGAKAEMITDRALLALQGPKAETALARLAPVTAEMRFMDVATHDWNGVDLWVSRSGYTGEDGFEISLPSDRATAFAEALLDMDEVAPIGLGARDSLRLEAGLCLYGTDITETTTLAEADLTWSVQKSRRTGGDRAGGFPGAARILAELEAGPTRHRVGLLPETRAPMRAGTPLFAGHEQIGEITSGGFSPSLEVPISMGYVAANHAKPGTTLEGELRGKRLPVTVTKLPFRPSTYKR